ncbi:MAG: polyprenyl synthetase family protein [Pseudomonadota bacterium]
MDLKTYLAERKEIVDIALTKSLADPFIPARLREAMEYSLKAGGKRIRPILVIAGAEAIGKAAAEVMEIACALEIIHTFSLVHDDLPAMDDDDLRRGLPTNHKKFGEATAILAGDALLAEAFWLLTKKPAANAQVQLQIINDIATATGGRGMTGGQQIDIDASGKKISLEHLNQLHKMKTGCLLTVAATSGAKYCGATAQQIQALENYGQAIGLAFQIADDILDIEGNQQELGKDIGSDLENEKATYPSLLGLDKSKIRAQSLVNEAIAELEIFGDRAEPLKEIARYIVERRS